MKLLVALGCMSIRAGFGLSVPVDLGHRTDKGQSKVAGAKGQHEVRGA